MGTRVASLYAEIGADTTGLKRGLNETKTGLENVANTMGRVGSVMTVGLTLPVVAGFAKMVDAASDLSETMNKVGVVFGDSADEVIAFGNDAARALGMSKQGALEAAGTFGNLFTSMGLGQDKAAGMSTSLLTLAADLASFNNIDPTVALEKLRAGLVGEVEPLRTLGVNLSAVAVEEKAVEMGLVAVGEEMNAAAKAQASYALIMEQTTNAQGDFARTSDGLANSTRTLKAQISDAAAEMGENLLPIALDLTQFLGRLVERFSDLDPASQRAILGFAALAASIGPVLAIGGRLLAILPALQAGLIALNATALGPIGIAIGAVAAAWGIWNTIVKAGDIAVEVHTAKVRREADAIDGLTEALKAGIITQIEYDYLGSAGAKNADENSEAYKEYAAALADVQARLADYNATIEAVIPGDSQMIENNRAGANAAIERARAQEELNAATNETESIFGELYNKYNDVQGIQSTLIQQGIDMIDGLGAQARATALLAYWNGELSLAEYSAAVQQSFHLDTLQQLNEALDNGSISQLTWIAIMSDGVATAEELARAMNNGSTETEIMTSEMETTTGAAKALEIELGNVSSMANSISGRYDITFDVSVTGDAIPDLPSTPTNTYYTGPTAVGFASGTDAFVVPPGYEDDSFPMRVSSGEVVSVAKPGETPAGGDTYNITINASGGADGGTLYRQFKQALDEDLRATGRSGVQTSDY